MAAKGGVWKPDLLLINANLTPWVLEMILALPNALFFAAFWWLRLLPGAGVISPGQLDIVEGRKSMLDWHFAEIVQVSLSWRCGVCCCTFDQVSISHCPTAHRKFVKFDMLQVPDDIFFLKCNCDIWY